jgi:WD40 repeat protein
MVPPSQKPKPQHPLPLWVRWVFVLIVVLMVLGGTLLWILEPQAIIPLAILTSLGVLIALFQLFPHLFPNGEQKHVIHVLPHPSEADHAQLSPLLSPHPSVSQYIEQPRATFPKIEWGEAPHTELFYGREQELTELKHWMLIDRCRVIAILGMGGIGKTSLAAMLTEQVQAAYTSVFWRSLQHAPPLKHVLQACITFLSDQHHAQLPEEEADQVTLLLDYLRKHRCLLIFDNLEAILHGGKHAGHYREGYEDYGRLLHHLGEARHQSCVLLTSREKPSEIAMLEGKHAPVRSVRLEGLQPDEGRALLQDKALQGTEQIRDTLITHYAGNPLALKLVAQFIQEVCDGDIADFLANSDLIFSDIRDVLNQQFERLLPLEQAIMYWLAIEREAVRADILKAELIFDVAMPDVQEAIRSLRRRSLIEMRATGISLQNVIMEYVTHRLVVYLSEEITGETVRLFEAYALMKAEAKEYVRESQVRLILQPLAQRLLSVYGREGLEQLCRSMLSRLREHQLHSPGYAAGNVLNLLVQLRYDLTGYDFSRFAIRQAYLQGALLSNVSFVQCQFVNTLFTHTFGSVRGVAFRLQGDLLAAGTETGEIWCWRVADGTFLYACQGHTNWVNAVAFSPDGDILASGSTDQTIRLWEAQTGKCLSTLQGHSRGIDALAFNHDGDLLASASVDQTIRIWEVRTGVCLFTFEGYSGEVNAVSFSPDGHLLASGGEDPVQIWEVQTNRRLQTFHGHTGSVETLSFHPNGVLLATGSEDHTVRLWQLDTGMCLRMLQAHTNWVRSVAFHPEGDILVSGSYDQTIRLWEVSTGRCLRTLHGHTSDIRAVAFSPDGRLLISGGSDQSVRVWEVHTGHCLYTLYGHSKGIRSVAWHPEGNLFASSSYDQTIWVWDAGTASVRSVLTEHTAPVLSVAFSADGQTLISGSQDHTVRLWEVSTNRCLSTFSGHTKGVLAVASHPQAPLLASGSRDQTVRLWERQTSDCLHILHGHTDQVRAVAFSPDERLLASGSDDQTICLWEISSGQRLSRLQHESGYILSLTFSPHGELLVSSHGDGSIIIWDLKANIHYKTLRGERPYEGMNITNVKGLTEMQKAMLKSLGAVEFEAHIHA